MYRRTLSASIIVLIAACSSACDVAPSERLLAIRATGTVVGLAYLDSNGNGTLEPGTDGRVANVSIRLLPRGGGGVIRTGATDAAGNFTLADIPVGDYDVRIEDATVPDSLRLIRVDSASVRVNAGDTVGVAIALGFPAVTVREARTLALGKRVFIEGVTHNSLATFGDSTLHVADTSGVIRVTRVAAAALGAGQRIRLLGTAAVESGQRTLTNATAFALGAGTQPAAASVTTAVAAHADNGNLDAALVRVTNAVITGSQTNAALDVILAVSDGSGLLDIVIDRQSGIATGTFVPGATLSATGLLVPSATAGVWELKPRTNVDLTATFATVTVAEARQLPPGRVVTIEGVALNSWVAFADSTIHLNDATGSIRASRVAPVNLFAGDRARLLGTIALRDGQTTLTNVTPTVLGVGVLPLPIVLPTVDAATADNGRVDAALVKVVTATIDTTVTVAGDLILTVNDGTGPLEVVLDRDVGFALAPFVKGAVVDVTGVLVTTTGGAVWRLKPRQPGDVILR